MSSQLVLAARPSYRRVHRTASRTGGAPQLRKNFLRDVKNSADKTARRFWDCALLEPLPSLLRRQVDIEFCVEKDFPHKAHREVSRVNRVTRYASRFDAPRGRFACRGNTQRQGANAINGDISAPLFLGVTQCSLVLKLSETTGSYQSWRQEKVSFRRVNTRENVGGKRTTKIPSSSLYHNDLLVCAQLAGSQLFKLIISVV